MFFAISLHADDRADRTDRAARLHAERLAATDHFGRLARRSFPGGAAYWDEGSSHALLSEDPDGSSFLLRGGYIAAADAWDGDRHTTEAPDTWGEFAAARVRDRGDGASVEVWADPAGSWPLYHGVRGRQVVISNDPHFVAIALGVRALSTQGAFELLAYHHAIGSETTIEGVQAMGAGRIARAEADSTGSAGLRVSTRSRHRYTSPSHGIDRTYEALLDSVPRIPPLNDPERVLTLQISGGLDSRLTLGVLAEALTARPEAVTLDLSTEEELEIARRVATALGFPHRTARLDEITLDAAQAGWLLTGGQVSVHAATGNILSYDVAATAPNGDVTIVGAWPGDCLIGSYVPFSAHVLSPVLRGWALRDWGRKRAPLWRTRGVQVHGPAAGRIARRAQRSLRTALLRSPGRSAAQAISAWAMFERQPRFSYISPAILSHDVLAVTPVLAGPYLEALLSLAPGEIIAKNFYRRMIHDRLPALRDVPNANTGAPVSTQAQLPPRLPRSRPELFDLLPLVVQEAVRRLRPANHYIGTPAATAETDFWNALFTAQGVTARVDLDGVTIDGGSGNDLHVRSVALALTWSKKYLDDAWARLERES